MVVPVRPFEQPWDGGLAWPGVMGPGWPEPGGRDVRGHGAAAVGVRRTLLAAVGVLQGLVCRSRCPAGGWGLIARPARVLGPRCGRRPRGASGSRRSTCSRDVLARRTGQGPLDGQSTRLLHVPGSRRGENAWCEFGLLGRGGGRAHRTGGRGRPVVARTTMSGACRTRAAGGRTSVA